LTNRIEMRKKAYQYIYNKLQESGNNLSYNPVKLINATNVISLAELDKLRQGIADPSEELIVALKTLLHHVDSEGELEEYLVKPFLPGSRSSS